MKHGDLTHLVLRLCRRYRELQEDSTRLILAVCQETQPSGYVPNAASILSIRDRLKRNGHFRS